MNRKLSSRKFGLTLAVPTKNYDPEERPPQEVYNHFAHLYSIVEKGTNYLEATAASQELDLLSSEWFGDREFFYSEKMSVWPH
jgi:hypothetical protein